MNNLILYLGTIVGTLVIGSFLGYYTRQTIAKKQAGTIESKLNKLISDAKEEARKTISQAKEKASKILEEIKDQERDRHKQLSITEKRLYKREQDIDSKSKKLEEDYAKLKSKISKVKKINPLRVSREPTAKLNTLVALYIMTKETAIRPYNPPVINPFTTNCIINELIVFSLIPG